MRKFLRLLVLVAASAIPGLAMAATSYGISICGTAVTSDNASSISGSWLRSGSIRYDYSNNKLYFSNVNIFADAGITVSNTCKDGLHMRFSGINTISTNGVAFYIQKANGNSNVDVFFEGDGEGILNINWHTGAGVETQYGGEIYCNSTNGNYPWVCIGNGVQGGEATHSALTVNAESIRGANGGCFYISDGCVNLKGMGGTSYSTIRGFNNVYINGNGNGIWTDGVSYNASNMRLQKNGSIYTGAVYAGWQKYGLRICGIEVTYKNKGDISDHTNPAINNLAICQHGTTNSNAIGSLTYDPSTNKLTFGDNSRAGVDLRQDRGKIDAPAIENNTGKTLIITTKSASDITTIGTSRHGIVSDQSLTFNGGSTTQLGIKTTEGNSIRLTADDLTLLYNVANVNMQSWPHECINTDAPNSKRWTWTVYDSNVTTLGCVRGVKAYNMSGCGIATEQVFIDPYSDGAASPMGYLRKFKLGEYFGTFEIKRASTSYGFYIAGISVNNVNANNLYNEFVTNGTAVYDASAKTLTLNDFQVDYQNKKQITHLNISKSAPEDFTIVANGNNYFKNSQSGGMACVIYNADGVSTSQVSRWLRGTGTLDFGETASIGLYDGVWFCIGGNNLSGVAANVTLKGGSIAGTSSSQAVLQVSEGNLELAGNSYGTARYLRSLFGPNYTGHEMLPSTVSYDLTDGRVENANGGVYTGALSIGWKKYGLSVCNVPVTAGNKDCLADIINAGATAANPIVRSFSNYNTAAASDAIKYDPVQNRLTLKNAAIWDNYNSNRGEAGIDNQTGKSFEVYTSGNARIVRSDGQPCGIRSNAMLTIMGDNLTMDGSTALNARGLIVMNGDDLTLRFWNTSNTTLNGLGTSAPTINTAADGQWLKLETHDCTLNADGVIRNVKTYTPDRTAISTSRVVWDHKSMSFVPWGSTNSFVTSVAFKPATSYGITIAGLDLNNVSKDNFYTDAIKSGAVSYDERAGEVTLSNVVADLSVLTGSNTGIVISSNAVEDLKLKIVGQNTFTGYNGAVAMHIDNATGASTSQVSRYITGNGTLDLGENGEISIGNSAWVCIGDGVQGGSGEGGVTLKARNVRGRNGNGILGVSDGALELAGTSYGTYVNMRGFIGGDVSGMTTSPADVSMNYTTNLLEQNGAMYTGPLRLGWEEYGLSICGTPVNASNKNDIKAEGILDGSVSFDPSVKTLTLNGAELFTVFNSKPCIDNTINGLVIKTISTGNQKNDRLGISYDSKISTSISVPAIHTTGNITFSGTGSLLGYASVGHIIVMDGHNLIAKFNSGSNTTLYGWDEDPQERSVIGVAEETALYGISLDNATLTTNGWMKHIGYFDLNRAEFKPRFGGSRGDTFLGSMLCDETGDHMFHLQGTNGVRSYFHGNVEIVPATSYGIKVGGYDVNDQNYRYIVGGSLYTNGGAGVRYNPEENVLTLSKVNAYDKYAMLLDSTFVERHSNGINITANAPKDLKIMFEGPNNFFDINGVGLAVHNSATFIGDGSLSLLTSSDGDQNYQYAPIYLYDGSDLRLNDEVKVYASQLVGRDGNGGGLYIMGDDFQGLATLDLSGDGSTATIRGISGVHDAWGSGYGGYATAYSTVLIPNGGSYDYSAKTLKKRALGDGSTEKGRVLIAPAEDYGIYVNSMRVNSHNAEDILAGTEFEYSGKLSFNDNSNELTMDNLTLQSGLNLTSLQAERPYIIINLIGDNEWVNPNQMIFRSGDAYFTGTGSMTYPNEIQLYRRQRDLYDQDGSQLESEGAISIQNCTLTATNIRSTVDNMNGLVNGTLEFSEANVTLTGSSTASYTRATSTIEGFAYEPSMGWSGMTRIATPADWSWYDNNGAEGSRYTYLTSGGRIYQGLVKILTSYGINVAGIEVTGENKDDILGDGGSVSFAPAADDDDFGYVSRLVLKRATVNGPISFSENHQDGDCVVELIDNNTINAASQTAIKADRTIHVSSRDAYGKLFVNTSGTGVELRNSSDLRLYNAELNINAGTYGIHGQYTGEDQNPTFGSDSMNGYEGLHIVGTVEEDSPTGAPSEPTLLYTKLVVKNTNSRYPLVANLHNYSAEGSVAVQEPTRSYFDASQYGFVGSNGQLLANTTLVISNDDYNTVGISQTATEELTGNGDVYDLSGRKMNNARIQRGVYIVNGKKVAVK